MEVTSVSPGAGLAAFADAVGVSGPVAVEGGRTHWEVGGACGDGTRLVSAPGGVRSFDPSEMTVRVGAGTALAELDETLGEAGQRVTLPLVPGATVGGVLAVGYDGLHALGRGRVRDSLLQAIYVGDTGELVTAGGATVKNVSGFDLCRLLVGSLGTLGLLGEVVLRTWPRPAAQTWLAGECDPVEVRRRLYWPSSVLWDGTTAWVHVEGHELDVAAEIEVAKSLGLVPVDGPPVCPPHRAHAQALVADPQECFLAQIGTGTVYLAKPGPAPETDHGVVGLHRRLKAEFDPRGRLNPGRDPLQLVSR